MNSVAPSSRAYRQVARASAAEETGRRIVGAFVRAATAKRYADITLDEVAAAAGVTRQTVIRRFENKLGLLWAAAGRLSDQVESVRFAVAPDDPADAVRALVQDYEATGDLIINILAEEDRSPELTQVLDVGRAKHRGWVETSFGARLAGLPTVLRDQRVTELQAITDVWVWRVLRRDQKRPADEVARLITDMVQCVLAASRQVRSETPERSETHA
jgi:AcrR family transcriptional regulator